MSAARPRSPLRRACAPALLALILAGTSWAVAAPAAEADLFGGISLASVGSLGGGPPQQAEYARDAAVSGDGRYVAFDGSVGGVGGVWRWDRNSDQLQQVAGGDAEVPSISGDGRYVSFTTNEGASLPAITHDRPLAEPHREAVEVYVRDMAIPPLESAAEEAELRPQPGERAFVAASAPSGSAEPLTFSEAGTTLGASAAGRSSISADGNEVAFVTTAVSDLVEGTPGEPSTPPLQVAVRYLGSQITRLVSEEYVPLKGLWTGKPVSARPEGMTFGAVYPGSSTQLGFKPPPTNGNWVGDPPPGASISADGSTVAWMGEDIGAQAPMLPGEQPSPLYTEPLWRRIASGSETRTERVTGGSEPANPACLVGGEGSLPAAAVQSLADPCQGPFEVQLTARSNGSRGIWSEAEGGNADFVPRLSADGRRVAFIATAPPTGFGTGLTGNPEGEQSDLYTADMSAGLSRRSAITPLTQIAGSGYAAAGEINDLAVSPDGAQVAFTTRRTVFRLGFPALVSPALPEPGESELFDADLQNGTLTQVTRGAGGEASFQPHPTKHSGGGAEGEEDPYGNDQYMGAESPSFSADGQLIAFSSTASNLVYGDGNTPTPLPPTEGPFDGSDAFLVARIPFVSLPTPNSVSPPPVTVITPEWQLGASAVSRRDGTVLLYLSLPGRGAVRVAARSPVPVLRRRASHGTHGGRRASRTVLTRTVASSSRTLGARSGEIATVVVRLGTAYAGLAARNGGLSAVLAISFSAPGHPTLRQSLRVNFARKQHRAAHGANARRSPPHRKGGRS